MSESSPISAKGPNWGRWGADDERGALNLLTPEVILAGAATVRTGKVYSLSIPIDRSGPHLDYRGAPMRLTLTSDRDEDLFLSYGGSPGIGANEDVVSMGTHTATHLDALSHVYAENLMYNGHSSETMKSYSGAGRNGIDKVGSIVTRGVLIDVAAAKGVDRLDFSYSITAEDLREALDRQAVELRPGDAALIRTGWLEHYLETGEFRLDQPGLSLGAARFLGDCDVSVVGADNTSIEVQPFDEGIFLGGHIELLVKRGIHLIEHLALGELAADGVSEMLLVVAPLKITGGNGSPVNPIAIT